MEGLSFAVFGTGDSLYQKFNYMAKMLHNRLKQLGGNPIVNRGLGDESDAKGHAEAFFPWIVQLWGALGLPTLDESDKLMEDLLKVPLLTRYNVSLVEGSVECDAPAQRALYNQETFNCVVEQNIRLTPQDYFQGIHHVAFSRVVTRFEGGVERLAPLSFEVGDALGVYCVNKEKMIDDFFVQTQQIGDAVVCVTPNTSEGLLQQRYQPFFGRSMTLRSFLKHYVDLEAVASRLFFGMLAHFAQEDEVRERLFELASLDNVDDFMSYSYREKRNVVEVLTDFRTVRPPLSVLLSFLPLMRPRFFSISSAPSLDVAEIHLTVAELSWQTPLKRSRKGVCSSYLTAAVAGDVFTCCLWRGSLTVPSKPTPLICVGTGTGIAPLRALIRECAASASVWSDVPILLLFGCRHEGKDYLYANEWPKLGRDCLKQLTVLPAFSRDGDKKFYVQHQLGCHARRVAALLDEGACIYVCGNSTPMPKDVAVTFDDIATQCCCGGDEVRGQEYMKQLRKQGRYAVDSWSA
ncbi:NADPH-dependent FMN/FAD containing oxidoreductase [Trypanosoma rangeli SC58]|uniref:NADPH-dependent FMN/FAD containing oxidoreductase n=1 Tax=Trypanosoma rangeli SC58 TaxID=429131 RepID=A0A061IZB1_TRYRA|nr:NADPH-dependent FMN/FAD containing oxidoreductase [Trypanosoma rangeli SC58]